MLMLGVATDGASDLAEGLLGDLLDAGLSEEAAADVEQLALNGSDLARSFAGCSFAPDTPVLMADGHTKPIKDVKIGDQVEATNPKTGQTLAEPVTQLHDNLDTDMADLLVTANGKRQTIHTTQNHPFWDQTTHAWTRVDHLTPGDHLHTPTGVVATVAAVHTWTAPHHMLNLTIQQIHTYYVLAGNTPVLVHNSGCDEWAAGFAKQNGGEIKTFVGPGGDQLPMGPYRPKGPNTPELDESWFHHTVVVRDGKVYDQWHPNGIGIDEYKTRFDYWEDIDFGF